MEYFVGQVWVTCPVHTSLQVQPFHTQDFQVTLVSIVASLGKSLLHADPWY